MATLAITAVSNSIGRSSDFLMQPLNRLGLSDYLMGDVKKTDKLSGKVKNLVIQTSSYNEIIPIVYGTAKLAGNIIWATDVKEVINSSTSGTSIGGKGGRTITQTYHRYSYFATFAVGICAGEIDELNYVWADEELLELKNIKHTLYKGTSIQNPDPLIQSYQGIDYTPAYRDLAYIVFEDFPITNYGNRIPNLCFEITCNPTKRVGDNCLENKIKSIVIIPGTGEFVYDTEVQSKLKGDFVEDKFIYRGSEEKINQNS